jgi:caffeoyl-CoA O-methyltransferase
MAAHKSFLLSDELADYIVGHSTQPDEIQRALIGETAALGAVSGMQVSPEQGMFLTILTRLLNVERAVEVGTFTGYSALCIARGLAPGGRLLACDVSDEWTSIGKKYWEQAGIADRIDLRIAPAVETLRALPGDEVIDLAFVDADKPSYPLYYEELTARLRPNGVLLVDNVLWSGNVVDESHQDDNTKAIRAFNEMVAADDRVDVVMLSIADGLTLCRKR